MVWPLGYTICDLAIRFNNLWYRYCDFPPKVLSNNKNHDETKETGSFYIQNPTCV